MFSWGTFSKTIKLFIVRSIPENIFLETYLGSIDFLRHSGSQAGMTSVCRMQTNVIAQFQLSNWLYLQEHLFFSFLHPGHLPAFGLQVLFFVFFEHAHMIFPFIVFYFVVCISTHPHFSLFMLHSGHTGHSQRFLGWLQISHLHLQAFLLHPTQRGLRVFFLFAFFISFSLQTCSLPVFTVFLQVWQQSLCFFSFLHVFCFLHFCFLLFLSQVPQVARTTFMLPNVMPKAHKSNTIFFVIRISFFTFWPKSHDLARIVR